MVLGKANSSAGFWRLFADRLDQGGPAEAYVYLCGFLASVFKVLVLRSNHLDLSTNVASIRGYDTLKLVFLN